MASITNELKTCRKKLHQYSASKRTCPECRKIYLAKWYKTNIEERRAYESAWKKANPEKNRAHQSAWQKRNPDKNNVKAAKRNARKKQALASWRNDQAIEKIYAEATRLSKETGVKHQVDHIYPLKSDWLCGLHVETNLQILTAEENIRKNNKTWPGQYAFQRLDISAMFEPELIKLLNEKS